MRSPQYSDIADEQEMLLSGGLNASDSGFGGSSNVLHPDEAGMHQVLLLAYYVDIDFSCDATATRWARICWNVEFLLILLYSCFS